MPDVLFLLRPPQTGLPYGLPRDPRQQAAWHREIQDAYGSTLRVTASDSQQESPAGAADAHAALVSGLKDLGELHRSGDLSDEEFAAAKTKLLSSQSR